MELKYIGIGIIAVIFLFLIIKGIRKRRKYKIPAVDYDSDMYGLNTEIYELKRKTLTQMQKEIDTLRDEVYRLKKKIESNRTNMKDITTRVQDIEDIVN